MQWSGRGGHYRPYLIACALQRSTSSERIQRRQARCARVEHDPQLRGAGVKQEGRRVVGGDRAQDEARARCVRAIVAGGRAAGDALIA